MSNSTMQDQKPGQSSNPSAQDKNKTQSVNQGSQSGMKPGASDQNKAGQSGSFDADRKVSGNRS